MPASAAQLALRSEREVPLSIRSRGFAQQLQAAKPGQFCQLVRGLLCSSWGRVRLARAILTDDGFLLAVVRLVAARNGGQADGAGLGALPAVDTRIIQFMQTMSPDELRHYAETGELPPRPVCR